MLTDINPKLPMRDKSVTREFYINKLGFQQFGNNYDGYLMEIKPFILSNSGRSVAAISKYLSHFPPAGTASKITAIMLFNYLYKPITTVTFTLHLIMNYGSGRKIYFALGVTM